MSEQAGTGGAAPNAEGAAPAGTTSVDVTVEEKPSTAAFVEMRRENAQAKKALKAAQDELAKREAEAEERRKAEMSEVERANAKAAEAEKKLAEREAELVRVQRVALAEREARSLGVREDALGDVVKLVDLDEFDDAESAKAAMAAFLESKPYFAAEEPANEQPQFTRKFGIAPGPKRQNGEVDHELEEGKAVMGLIQARRRGRSA